MNGLGAAPGLALGTAVTAPLHAGAAAVLLAAALLVLARGRGARPHAAALGAAALWAAAVAFAPGTPLEGLSGLLEVLRAAAWAGLLALLCRRAGGEAGARLGRGLGLAALALGGLAGLLSLPGAPAATALPSLGSPALLARLALALLVVLAAENLWRNADEAAGWHVNLPCIALGGLAAFDVVLYAQAALSHAFSPALVDARAVLTALAAPLLVVAAARDRRWRRDPKVSREVVFHGATLVVAGAFLLGVGAAGEALRRAGAEWGAAAQASLVAGALMAIAVALASRSARSRLRRLVVDHFFAARFDYRREWLRCVATLSAPEREAAAPVRAVRALADAVDGPAGVLLLREEGGGALRWAGSWNRPAAALPEAAGRALAAALARGTWVLVRGEGGLSGAALEAVEAAHGPVWLAVPLPHPREGVLGAVLLAPPRAPFPLDGEVFDLLRVLAREVALFLSERRAAERLADERRLAEYAKRFAFVAHDVKTVSSQLKLLLANAEDNLQDPEFQADLLLTVRASAARIDALIARLRRDEAAVAAPPGGAAPLARLRGLARPRGGAVLVEAQGPGAGDGAAIGEGALDEVLTHLLDNAAEASPPGEPVRAAVRREGERMVVEIADRGPGMSPEFVRDELFRPLRTTKPGGSGIGAWQARELLRAAGGEVEALSRPGRGTTMRLVIPAAAPAVPPDDEAASPPGGRVAEAARG